MLKNYVIVDLETTGLSPKTDKIIEIGAIKIKEGCEAEVYNSLVNPGVHINQNIVNIDFLNLQQQGTIKIHPIQKLP